MDRNIEYWQDYWNSLFSGVESRRFRLNMLSPRILLRELKEEIETRGLKNSDNRQFLYNQINIYYREDPPSQSCLLPILTLIRREFQKPRLELLKQLCNRALKVFNSFEYFDAAVEYLTNILLEEKPVSRKNLFLVCQDLIVELSEFGYSQKFIEKIPSKIFSGATEHEHLVITEFPHDLSYPEPGASPETVTEYHRSLKDYVENLTVKDRLSALKKYPRLPKEELRFIFQVRGLRGSGEFQIGSVLFYPPQERKVISDLRGMNEKLHPEFFNRTNHVYFNAAVPVETPDLHSGALHAKKILINTINLLRFTLFSKAKYEIGSGYVAADKNGRLHGASWAADPGIGALHWHDSLNIDEKVLKLINESEILSESTPLISTSHDANPVSEKLLESLHWFRKGKEAESQENQLLWFWIAIENLLNLPPGIIENGLLRQGERESVVSLAFDLLPRLRCLSNTYAQGWTLYHKIESLLSIPKPLSPIDLPNNIITRAGLQRKGKRIYLVDFVNTIPDIIVHLPDTVLREHLVELAKFYEDSEYAMKTIESERIHFRNDVVMLYRTRNKIVHSAKIEDTMLPYFIKSASAFSQELIRRSYEHFFRHKNQNLSVIISSLFSEYDVLLENIKQKGVMATLFDKN